MYNWPLPPHRLSHISFLKFLTCVPLIAADIPAVLLLDKRCLGGLWTKSGYQREIESDCSDLFVLVGAAAPDLIYKRAQTEPLETAENLAAKDFTNAALKMDFETDLTLLGIGCLWAILEEAHITTLAVEPSWQGRKLGLLLLANLLQAGDRRGLTRATLEVRASNQKALSLYRTFGFKSAGVRKRYYADGEDASILWCRGLQTAEMKTIVNQHKQRAIAYLENQHQQKFISTDADIAS